MKIIIVGCGEVGESLATQLVEEENNITVVDLSQKRVKELSEKLDVMGVVGNGATYTTLSEAGISSADLLIAVTESDELNLLCCVIAKKSGKCQVIARVRNPEYRSELDHLKSELGIAMLLNPEYEVASEIYRILRLPVATMVEPFAKGKVELVKFKLPEDNVLVGMSVRKMSEQIKSDVLICSVERGKEVFVANGRFVFEAGDVISVISTPRRSPGFFKQIGIKGNAVNDIIIVGAGNTTKHLLSNLKTSGISIKVIDHDKKKCDDVAAKYPDVIVINGDEADQELLMEEGIESCDAFIVLTASDEENILLSLFAKRVSNAKIVTRIMRTDYDHIVRHLDIDTVIYPKSMSSDMMARYVRAMKNKRGSNVETLYSFARGSIEAAQFVVRADSPLIGKQISSLELKPDVLIAAIIRSNKLIIPRGYDSLFADDSVIIVTKELGLEDLSEILK